MTKIGFALLLLFASSFSYGSQTAPQTKEYGRCMSKADTANPAMLKCVSDEYARQGKRLNAAYRNLMGSLKGDRRKQMHDVQHFLNKYTESNCGFFYNLDADTSAPMLATECKLTARIEQADELEELATYQ